MVAIDCNFSELYKIELSLRLLESAEEAYWCRTCSDMFSDPVRHCDCCDHHYQDTECGNCHEDMPKHSAEKVTPALLRKLRSRAEYLRRNPPNDLSGREAASLAGFAAKEVVE